MTSKVIYEGNLRTEAVHMASDTRIVTDAPIDNNGKGMAFSPTDLVATALASCMCTIMGMVAANHNLNIDGVECEVEKVMLSGPRRIGQIKISVIFPKTATFTSSLRSLLERSALTCPVFESLHPDCQKSILFIWP